MLMKKKGKPKSRRCSNSLSELSTAASRRATGAGRRANTGTIKLLELNLLVLLALHLLVPNLSVGHDASVVRSHAVLRKLVLLNVLEWPDAARGIGVLVHEDVVVLAEVAVEIFEGAVGGLWIEEIHNRDEAEIQHCPNDVELPAQGLDTGGGDFDNHEVEDPL